MDIKKIIKFNKIDSSEEKTIVANNDGNIVTSSNKIDGVISGSTAEEKDMTNNEKKIAGPSFFSRIFKKGIFNKKSKVETEPIPIKEKKKLNLEINFKNLDVKSMFFQTEDFWFRRYRIIIATLFFAVVAGGTYFLYQELYNSGWSESEKQQYINSQKKEVTFSEDKFDGVLEEIELRKKMSESGSKNVNNIFKTIEEEK